MNTRNKSIPMTAFITLAVVVLMISSAQAQTPANKLTDKLSSNRAEFRLDLFRIPARRQNLLLRPATFSLMPTRSAGIEASAMAVGAAGSLPVVGSGTVGKLTKWTGITSSNSVIGDSNIFEDKFGKVGIGTTTPTSPLTVQGMIEITIGGLKFPDGTVQTTSAAGAMFSVAHDATLQGNGTASMPLGVAVPLNLTGAIPTGASLPAVLNVTNTAETGNGVTATGGNGTNDVGGVGVVARGGSTSGNARAGDGAFARGGNGVAGGDGVVAVAGTSSIAFAAGARGVVALGGSNEISDGGPGVFAVGGASRGGGNRGGPGILAASITGLDGATAGLAGDFVGDVEVSGNLSKGGGSFKIDHPLDPENKHLYHSFVESPDMKNIYDGVIRLDANGEGIIAMPEWFSALNRDFRYLVTPIGAPMPKLYIAEELQDNHFRVAGGQPGMKVSWQVTGIRQDPYANKNRIKVEEDKPERERGFYLHPEAFNQPEERGIQWARNPELMQRIKDAREKTLKAKQD